MKAISYLRPGIGLVQAPEPQIEQPDDIKIKMHYASICGSDLHLIAGEWDDQYLQPKLIGHEAAGEIVEMGPKATVKGLKVGDIVAVYHSTYCGKCFWCRNGQEHLCDHKRISDESMAEYAVANEQAVHKVPDGLTSLQGCMAEPVSVCLHGVDLLHLSPGNTAAIFGAGGLGLVMTQLMRMAGASDITVIEPIEEKRQRALRLGATRVLDPGMPDFVQYARSIHGGRGFEKVMEVSGADAGAMAAFDVVSRGGTVVYFANYSHGFRLPVDTFRLTNDEIILSGVFQSPYIFPRTMEVLKQLDLSDLTETVFAIDDIDKAWEAQMSKKHPKIVLKIAQDI